jgi:hypothetical protein
MGKMYAPYVNEGTEAQARRRLDRLGDIRHGQTVQVEQAS